MGNYEEVMKKIKGVSNTEDSSVGSYEEVMKKIKGVSNTEDNPNIKSQDIPVGSSVGDGSDLDEHINSLEDNFRSLGKTEFKASKTKRLFTIPETPISDEYNLDIPTLGGIKDKIGVGVERFSSAGAKSLVGDVPLVREALPEHVKEFIPRGFLEKAALLAPRLARDLAMFAELDGIKLFNPILKLTKYQERLQAAQKASSGISGAVKLNIAQKLAPVAGNVAKGGIFGAVTADSSDPKEIAKSSGTMAGVFAVAPLAIGLGVKGILGATKALGAAGTSGALAGSVVGGVPGSLIGAASAKIIDIASKGKFSEALKNRLVRASHAVGLAYNNLSPVRDLLFSRYGRIGEERLKASYARAMMTKGYSERELELVPFLIEGTKIPKEYGRPDLEKLLVERGEALNKTLVPAVKQHFKEVRTLVMEESGKDVKFVENYVNRLWKIPESHRNDVVNWFMTKNPNWQKRIIPTIKEGMEGFVNKAGETIKLVPQTTNIATLMRIYDEQAISTSFNLKFIEGLKTLEKQMGTKLIMAKGKAPAGWVEVDSFALSKNVFLGKGKKNSAIIGRVPAMVHPDIAAEIKAVLENPSFESRDVVRAITGLNALAKHSELSLSLFHAGALTESAIGFGSFTLKDWMTAWKGVKKGEKFVFSKLEVAKDFLKHGGQVDPVADVHRGMIEDKLRELEAELLRSPHAVGQVSSKVVNQVRKPIEFMNQFLWDQLHPMYKINTYELLVNRFSKNPRFSHLPIEKLKREIAQIVNDGFGGQAWELMAKSKGWQKRANLLLLSPDWMISTTRQAAMPFGLGASSEIGRELRKTVGQDFWKKSMLILFTEYNMMNRVMSKALLGEERNLWENPPGNKTRVLWGVEPDGTTSYLRLGKQFREIPEFFIDEKDPEGNPFNAFLKKGGSKLSPWIQQAVIQASSGTTASGFKTQSFFNIKDARRQNKSNRKQLAQEVEARIKQSASAFVPFSFAGQGEKSLNPFLKNEKFDPVRIIATKSGGMSRTTAIAEFEKVLRIEDRSKRRVKLRRLMKFSKENGLDPFAALDSARGNLKREKTNDAKQEAKKLFERYNSLPSDESRKSFIKNKRKSKELRGKVSIEFNKLKLERKYSQSRQKSQIRKNKRDNL